MFGLDSGLEGLGVGTDNLGHLVATLEKEESGHGADAEFLGDVGDLVHVELVEARLGVCVGEPGTMNMRCRLGRGKDLLDDLGGNHFTRAAPCREAVENHERVLVVHGGVEFRLAVVRIASAAPVTYDVAHAVGEGDGGRHRHETYFWRLWTPCFCSLMLAVLEKKRWVKSGR